MAEPSASTTTKTMAYLLMGLFAVCLLATLTSAIWLREDRWFNSFKDGFAFLAGALATIIGYYFGNRNTDVAIERAKEATEKVKEVTAKAKSAEARAEAFRKEIVDVTETDDPVNPANSPVTDEGVLDSPQR